MYWLQKIFTGEFFSRHHEKIYIVDDIVNTGSQNIHCEYGGVRYGDQSFKDLTLSIRDQSCS
jgi:hypothetical protein